MTRTKQLAGMIKFLSRSLIGLQLTLEEQGEMHDTLNELAVAIVAATPLKPIVVKETETLLREVERMR